MQQSLDGLPLAGTHLTCSYANRTGGLQIVRVTNVPGWYFERVVFPAQTILFCALPEAQLEVYTGSHATCLLADTIPCTQLEIREMVSSIAVAAD
ncbi:MAG: DUF1830 domain-containing protein [Aphanocapsa lilacina HA4352-LM1]|jgi:hypothetical protein|nr:DUF1830 domain-containing protein [Aphanocapsa lilacina HA4352-LM1]